MAAAPDDPTEVAAAERAQRHRDWWTMPTADRQTVLRYETGYDDGYEDGVQAGYETGYAEGQIDALGKFFRALPTAALTALASILPTSRP